MPNGVTNNLHLHFTGSMRHSTLIELAAQHGVRLPDALVDDWPPKLSATDEKGWFRFQRLYDIARSVLAGTAFAGSLVIVRHMYSCGPK
jgi:adenosine deaminase